LQEQYDSSNDNNNNNKDIVVVGDHLNCRDEKKEELV